MRLRYFLIALSLIAIPSSVAATVAVGAKKYVALRRQCALNVPFETIKSDPQSYIGKVFEIRGKVCGVIRSDNGDTLMITSKDGSFQVKTDKPPVENPGPELACLVKINQGSAQSLSDLQLIACAYDVELQRLEEAWQSTATKKTVQANPVKPKPAQQAAKSAKPQVSQQISMEQLVGIYRNAIKGFNSRLSENEADKIARSVIGFSSHYKLDPRLVCAVILAESHFRIGATSHCGAQGLGQLMPSTAAGLGVNDAYDPVQNVYGSVRYIKGMLDRMTGYKDWNELTWNDLAITLAAYNAGPGAVRRHGGVPPYKETQNYVRRVTSIYKKLCGVK